MITVMALEARIRARYGIDGLSYRHTQAQIVDRISEAVQQGLEILSDHGCQDVRHAESVTSGVGASTGRSGTICQVSATVPVSRICSVQALVSGYWTPPLDKVTQDDEFGYTGTGAPVAWCPVGQDAYIIATGGTEIGTQRFMLLPATDSAYTLRVQSIPIVTLASTDSLAGGTRFTDWVECMVGLYLAQRDEETAPGVLAIRAQQEAAARGLMIQEAVARSGVGGTRVRDTRGRRRSLFDDGSR